MEAFRFNRHKKAAMGYSENSFTTKRLNWDRVIYYIVFVLIIGSLTLFILKKSYFVSAFGEVITNKFEVKFSDDVKVTKYYVKEKQEVAIGDTLLVMRPELSPIDSIGYQKISRNTSPSSNWIEHETITTKKGIGIKKIMINSLLAEVNYEKGNLKRAQEEVYLGLETVSKISVIEGKLRKIRGDIRTLREEVKMLNGYLISLGKIEENNSKSVVNVKFISDNVAYVSPVNGVVNQIYAKENEVTYKQEIAMDMLSFEDVFVSAYIPQKYLSYFNVNDTIGVKFNTNMNSLGVIKSIYFNTKELPIAFRNRYQKNTRNIIARIEPLNDSMQKDWKPFFKMAVQVYEPRIFKRLWVEMRMKKLNKNHKSTVKNKKISSVKRLWKSLVAVVK